MPRKTTQPEPRNFDDVAVLDMLGNPVLFVDREGHILRANPAAQVELKLPRDAIGQRVGDIFGLSVDDMLMRAWEHNGTISAATTLRSGNLT